MHFLHHHMANESKAPRGPEGEDPQQETTTSIQMIMMMAPSKKTKHNRRRRRFHGTSVAVPAPPPLTTNNNNNNSAATTTTIDEDDTEEEEPDANADADNATATATTAATNNNPAADDEEPNVLPESTAYWSKPNYAWSSSFHYVPPRLTSSRCAQALRDLFHNTYYDPTIHDPTIPNFLLNVVVESSSHPSGLHALFAQPYVYSGGGLGNFDECPLQNCMAASGQSTDSFTYASICLVPECSAYDVAAQDFTSVAARQLIQPHDYDDYDVDHNNDDDSLVESKRLGHDYVQLLQTIATINLFLGGGGWTCGNFVVPWTYVNSGFCAVLATVLVGLPLFRYWRSRQHRRRQRRRQCNRRHHDHDPHHRTTTTATTTAREQTTTVTTTSHHHYDSATTATTNGTSSNSACHRVVIFNTTTSTTDRQDDADMEQLQGPMVPAKEADDDDDADPLLYQPALLPLIAAALPAAMDNNDNHDDDNDDDWTAVWDISRHLQSLLAPSPIPCIDGLRVGSMVWIILGM
jgi:hypothetical protein